MASKPGTRKDFLYIPLSMWLKNKTLHRINKPTILVHDFDIYFSCCSFLKNMNWGLLTYNHKFQIFVFLTQLPNSVYLWKATLSCRASRLSVPTNSGMAGEHEKMHRPCRWGDTGSSVVVSSQMEKGLGCHTHEVIGGK